MNVVCFDPPSVKKITFFASFIFTNVCCREIILICEHTIRVHQQHRQKITQYYVIRI